MDIYVIPDTQVRPGVDTSYLYSIAAHIAAVRPAYIVMMGDWYDMPSLSYYDKGKKSHEVYNFIEDIEAGNEATHYFFDILDRLWKKHKKDCKKIFLTGNHEQRIDKAYDYGDPSLRALIRRFPMDLSRWDKVYKFLQPVQIAGCYFSHFFPNDNSGKALTSARMILNKRHRTCIAGHQQGFDYHEQLTVDGKTIHGLIAGSCYLHDESYKGPNNHHFRGTVILRDVKQGMFDIERHSLKRLMEKYQ